MPLLSDKTGIVFGVANKRSIAWAIAQALSREGMRLAFTYQGERLKESVEELTRALERLLRFEDERRRQAQLALERAAEFSVGRLGAETVDVYEQALQA